jgi:hypothetical protein
MRTVGPLAVVVVLASLTACRGSEPAPDKSATTNAPTTTATSTRDAPKPEKTYVPAAGDPKTHDLRVTIRDKGRSYAPGTCAAINGEADWSDTLGFFGPDKTYENRPLGKDLPIPKQGNLMADGTCEATMTVTLPYAPRYLAGIAIPGHGMPDPKNPAPKETKIVTKGDSQDVVIINYLS